MICWSKAGWSVTVGAIVTIGSVSVDLIGIGRVYKELKSVEAAVHSLFIRLIISEAMSQKIPKPKVFKEHRIRR